MMGKVTRLILLQQSQSTQLRSINTTTIKHNNNHNLPIIHPTSPQLNLHFNLITINSPSTAHQLINQISILLLITIDYFYSAPKQSQKLHHAQTNADNVVSYQFIPLPTLPLPHHINLPPTHHTTTGPILINQQHILINHHRLVQSQQPSNQ